MTLHGAVEAGAPAVLEVPAGDAGTGWADDLRDAVRRHGAVVLRGLGPRSADDVERISRALVTHRMVEREPFARRRVHAPGVYSSSEWPPNEPMCMHHELSYAVDCPRLFVAGCLVAPDSGGATAVADSHAVLGALPPTLVGPFERDGWLLVRNYGRAGLPWQEAFGTTDPAAVDAYCGDNAIDREWRPGGGLRTRQRRAAVVQDPDDGRPGWFNQVAFLSEWTLDPVIREYLVDTYGRDELPYNTFHGDGRPIEPDVVHAINDVYDAAARREPWRAGDVLVVDNVRMAHSREAYEGAREIVVVMGDPVRLEGHVLEPAP